MRSSGNSDVTICIDNIIRTFKSEVPYARGKGIRPETLDLPSYEVEQQLNEDAETAIEGHEPRVDVDYIEIDSYNESGVYKYKINVSGASIKNTDKVE